MKKHKPIEGDLFRYIITDGKINNGLTVYGYGRVLNETTAAFYSNDAHPPRKEGVLPSVEQILALDVAFVVGCTFDGFNTGLYELLENIELESKFKQPIYFYNRSVAENKCNISDIWDSTYSKIIDISEMPVQIERWGAYSHIHIEKRLGIYRA